MRLVLLALYCISTFAWASTPPTPITVFTEKAASKNLFNTLTYPARIESRVNAIVRAESDGAVDKILKPLGSRVHRGEIIAVVKHLDPVFQYAPLNVVASVSGVVNDVNVTPGSLVNKGDAVVSITDPDQLRVIVEIAAVDVRSVRRGLKGDLEVIGLQQKILATVQGLSPSVDPMLGTATCELKVSSADQKKILPGMVGHMIFKVNERKGYLLPDFAIVYRGDATFVRLVDNGVVKKIAVTVGEKRQGQVEVLTGLKDGDEVIDRSSRFVADGDSVQVDSAHE
jgi:multidrug efflux pump subunit AcrA (membrane-fusion protein)